MVLQSKEIILNFLSKKTGNRRPEKPNLDHIAYAICYHIKQTFSGHPSFPNAISIKPGKINAKMSSDAKINLYNFS